MSIEFDEDIVLAKLDHIAEAVARIETVTDDRDDLDRWVVDDLCALYLQRAIEACIDIANHLIAENGWTTPTSASKAFQILRNQQILSPDFTTTMTSMVGFRNIAVHAYGTLDVEIVRTLASDHLDDLRQFSQRIVDLTVGAK